MLILFEGAPGGHDPVANVTLPTDWETTLDRRRLSEAAVVVFHIPTMRRWWWPRKQRGQVWVAWVRDQVAADLEVQSPPLRR